MVFWGRRVSRAVSGVLLQRFDKPGIKCQIVNEFGERGAQNLFRLACSKSTIGLLVIPTDLERRCRCFLHLAAYCDFRINMRIHLDTDHFGGTQGLKPLQPHLHTGVHVRSGDSDYPVAALRNFGCQRILNNLVRWLFSIPSVRTSDIRHNLDQIFLFGIRALIIYLDQNGQRLDLGEGSLAARLEFDPRLMGGDASSAKNGSQ